MSFLNLTDHFTSNTGEFVGYEDALGNAVSTGKHYNLRSFHSDTVTIPNSMINYRNTNVSGLNGKTMLTLNSYIPFVGSNISALQMGQMDVLSMASLDTNRMLNMEGITVPGTENWSGTGVTVTRDAGQGYINTIQVALTGGVSATATSTYTDDIYTNFQDYSDYVIALQLINFPAQTAGSYLDLNNSYIDFTSDAGYAAGLTDSFAFSATANDISTGGNVTWQIPRSSLTHVNLANIVGIRFRLLSVGNITFEASNMTMYSPSAINENYVSIDTKRNWVYKNEGYQATTGVYGAGKYGSGLYNVGGSVAVNDITEMILPSSRPKNVTVVTKFMPGTVLSGSNSTISLFARQYDYPVRGSITWSSSASSLVINDYDYATTVLSYNPSLYWRLGDPSGASTIADISGNNRSGTPGTGIILSQPGAITGDLTTSTQFDDTSNGIITSTYSPFVTSSQRTYMGWANRTDTTTYDIIMGDSTNSTYLFANISGHDIYFQTQSGTRVSWTAAEPGAGVWYHWTLTYNDATKTAELFINGVSQGQKVAASGLIGGDGTFGIGSGAGNNWKGYMQDVTVYESILTSTQIKAIYNASVPLYNSGALAALSANNEYYLVFEAYEDQLRLSVWNGSGTFYGSNVFNSNWHTTTAPVGRGYIGWEFAPQNYDSYMKYFTVGDSEFARYESKTFSRFTNIKGASIAAVTSPSTNLIQGVYGNYGDGAYSTSQTKGYPLPPSVYVQRTGSDWAGGLITTPLFIGNPMYLSISGDIFPVPTGSTINGEYKIVFQNGIDQIGYIATLENILPNQWNHFEIPFNGQLAADDYQVIFEQTGYYADSFYLDNFALNYLTFAWEVSPDNGTTFYPFLTAIDDQWKGVNFIENPGKSLVLRGIALSDTSWVQSYELVPIKKQALRP